MLGNTCPFTPTFYVFAFPSVVLGHPTTPWLYFTVVGATCLIFKKMAPLHKYTKGQINYVFSANRPPEKSETWWLVGGRPSTS